MKKRIPLLFLVIWMALSANAQQQREAAVQGLIVRLAPETDVSAFVKTFNRENEEKIRLEKPLAPRLGMFLLKAVNPAAADEVLTLLRGAQPVLSAQKDERVSFRSTTPDDPLWPDQWGLERIGMPLVWDITTGGTTARGDEIVVAILDSGFDINHEDLQDNIWVNKGEIPGDGIDNDGNEYIDDVNGWDFYKNSNNLNITNHGTSVAGIVGSRGNNGLGTSGVNWNVRIMYLPIELISNVIEAFNYVIDLRSRYNNTFGEEGAFVVATNGSFGKDATFCSTQPEWAMMYDLLGQVGVLSVAATANENWDVEEVGDMPTTCTSDYLIGVTSTDFDDEKVTNAAFGALSIDLAAPGRETVTTNGNDRYTTTFGGNSAAAPHVAGAIALLYSIPCPDFGTLAITEPSAAARLVRTAIIDHTDPLPSLTDRTVSGGRLNVYGGMEYLHAWCIGNEADRVREDLRQLYIEEKNIVRVYPNPVSEQLTIVYGNEGFDDFSVRIFNVLGQEMEIQAPVQNRFFEGQTLTVNVSDWSNGTYFILVGGTDEKIAAKFVKQ